MSKKIRLTYDGGFDAVLDAKLRTALKGVGFGFYASGWNGCVRDMSFDQMGHFGKHYLSLKRYKMSIVKLRDTLVNLFLIPMGILMVAGFVFCLIAALAVMLTGSWYCEMFMLPKWIGVAWAIIVFTCYHGIWMKLTNP